MSSSSSFRNVFCSMRFWTSAFEDAGKLAVVFAAQLTKKCAFTAMMREDSWEGDARRYDLKETVEDRFEHHLFAHACKVSQITCGSRKSNPHLVFTYIFCSRFLNYYCQEKPYRALPRTRARHHSQLGNQNKAWESMLNQSSQSLFP